MNLEVREVHSFEELMDLAPQWRNLLPNSGEDDVFLHPEWMECWWKVWGDQNRMCSLVVLHDDELVGMAPLMLSPRGRVKRWTKMQFLATGPSDHLGVIAKNQNPEVMAAVWRHVHEMEGWDVLELRELWESAPTYASFWRSFPDFECMMGASPYVDLTAGDGQYFDSIPGVEKRQKRYWNKLKKDHDVEYREYYPTEDLQARLKELKDVNLKRWEGEGSSPFSIPRMERFLYTVVGEHAASLGLTFRGLYSGDRVIALNLGFIHNKRYLYYISGHDSEFASYSPGSVLRTKILGECLNQGFEELDFLRGSERHKFQYNAKDRGLVSVRLIRPGIVRGVEARLREGEFH